MKWLILSSKIDLYNEDSRPRQKCTVELYSYSKLIRRTFAYNFKISDMIGDIRNPASEYP